MAVRPRAKRDFLGELEALREEVQALRAEALRGRRAEQQKIRHLSRAVEQSPNIVLITDTDGHIEYVNPKFTEITGYSMEEVRGRNPSLLKSSRTPREHFRRLWKTILAGHEWRGEFVNRKKNGELYWGMSAISPIRNEAGEITHFLEVMEDVTERRRLEAAIVQVSEQERLLIGQELHDVIGQELTGVTLLAKVLEKKLAGSAAHEDAKGIVELAGKALKEVKDLAHGLYPSQLERSGLGPALEELARDQMRLFRVPCAFIGDGQIPPFDALISRNLYRIAQEATNNAIKHAQAKRIEIVVRVTRDRMTLEVDDDGVGIPESAVRGEGLGLRIMKYRANMIGAALDFKKRPGGGTVVSSVLNLTNRVSSGMEERRKHG